MAAPEAPCAQLMRALYLWQWGRTGSQRNSSQSERGGSLRGSRSRRELQPGDGSTGTGSTETGSGMSSATTRLHQEAGTTGSGSTTTCIPPTSTPTAAAFGSSNMASGGESDTGSMTSSTGKLVGNSADRGSHKSSGSKREHSREKTKAPFTNQNVPMIKRDDITFGELQKRRLKEMEKKMEEEMRRKKKEWEREVEKMREEFLRLYPSDKEWGSEELIADPLVYRRKGSTDVLDKRKMKTLFMEYPDSGRRYKLRFDVSEYVPESVEVTADSDIIQVKAVRQEEGADGKITKSEFIRKVERPSKVDPEKLKSHLTKDGILIVEAPLPPHSLNLRKSSASPSHSSISTTSTRSRSPSNSPHTPSGSPKMGIPVFTGKNGERRMHLIMDIGKVFGPKDTSVHALKENRIIVKAKHEERTSERFSKNKFSKEFELTEKIDPYTLRAGMTDDGKLIIGALGKHTDAAHKAAFTKDVVEEIAAKATPCNVLALASFPPVTPTGT